ncbi:MAG TPA: NADPH:quinone oxidoreductase family protein, partial [Caulobacteraceae bacterium]
GAEVAGIVDAVGEGVTTLRRGDRVAAVLGWGGLQERVAVAAGRCLKIGDDMPFEEAAAFLMTYGTSYHALKDRAQLKAGETLLVLGAAGGVGSAAVELGKAMGARVVAGASSADKVEAALAMGADNGFVYPTGKLDRAAQKALSEEIKLACGKNGADVIYDAVGGDYAEPALRSIAWGGRYLVVGFPAGIPSIPLNLTLLKGCQIVGVFFGAHTAREPDKFAANLKDLVGFYGEGRIRPRVSRTFPLQAAGDAIGSLADRTAIGKVVVTVAD